MNGSRAATATIVLALTAFGLTIAAILGRRQSRARPTVPDEAVDDASMDSFPASDPPAFGGTTTVGTPKR